MVDVTGFRVKLQDWGEVNIEPRPKIFQVGMDILLYEIPNGGEGGKEQRVQFTASIDMIEEIISALRQGITELDKQTGLPPHE